VRFIPKYVVHQGDNTVFLLFYSLLGIHMFWSQAQHVSAQAMLEGSLLPISTEPRIIVQNDIHYYLHLKNANSKKKFAPKPDNFNPFLPYEPEMFVARAGSEHVCLLNKFPVLAPHLLICSNTFIEQTAPLQLPDFNAWIMGFNEPDVLGFYNGGRIAGASQPHRHMQLVKTEIPLEPMILNGDLPFKHQLFVYEQLSAEQLVADYTNAMTQMGLFDEQECKPYNVLLTSRWMLVLPRTGNNIEGIFANGINYSGHFLLSTEAQMQWLTDFGVVRFLNECAT
jgi:ATP adenylyltransferase